MNFMVKLVYDIGRQAFIGIASQVVLHEAIKAVKWLHRDSIEGATITSTSKSQDDG